VDGSGQLSRKEFKEALKAAELGLTRKDINLILSQVSIRNGYDYGLGCGESSFF
jgi:hypothetical protein